ncbi:GNAT family N-acetyltransferase [Ktedonospora formicarum]|uniref:Acetyltransferase n=1 Tax=Ktedonospora formicarum TaxID=2778364 RepID=A0A8J3I452_9CHLR|nr:GNAT family N-acetyltransferase [Ktedonospora formicarum]GHO46538.1 acetyltransferase [Ktedonospora formicarum]
MSQVEPHTIIKEEITKADHASVRDLLSICEQHDGQGIPINLETLNDGPGNGLLYYRDAVLVGVAFIFSMDTIETIGSVHPSYRRQGIGSELLKALKAYSQSQNKQGLTLMCSNALPGGEEFARHFDAEYCFSEYHMELQLPLNGQPTTKDNALSLRQAEPSEASLVTDISAQAFGDDPNDFGPWIQQAILKPGRRFFFVRHHDNIIGVISAVQEDEQSADITTFGILPAYRKRGYGRQVLTHMVEMLLAEGWQKIALDVETENSNALTLYQSCGFQQARVYSYHNIPL